ncbi:Rieske 2Fe-2S domain-containing protein, partial [Frankia casuarinae]
MPEIHIKNQKPRLEPPADPVPKELAASWYVALASGELRGQPKAFQLFGRDVVAWREASGRPAVAGRYCPHQGASLALGAVVDGCLRCPFHGWRFDSSGACVEVPRSQRIPTTARLDSYPTIERFGYIWVWYGTRTPLFELPGFPALEEEQEHYLGFRYTDWTAGHPRQLLENAFDYFHFQTLHSLPLDRAEFRVLSDPEQ